MTDWRERYMRNLVSLETLHMLADAGKLSPEEVTAWVAERKELYGM